MASIDPPRITSSGEARYDVRYRLASGQSRSKTFRTKREAKAFEARVEADKSRGGLLDPRAGKVALARYFDEWIDHRRLRPRTIETYQAVFQHHIAPTLGKTDLAKLDVAAVRAWLARLRSIGVGDATQAKSYRLLRALLNTAVEDRLILANPCQIRGAGIERAPERPVATPEQMGELAGLVQPEHRCMVLLAGYCGMRLGEILGLANRHVSLMHKTITIERQLQELAGGRGQVFSEPKTDSGNRTIAIPATVAAELRVHIERYAEPGPDGLLFTGARGGPLRRAVWTRDWHQARAGAGLSHLRFHDLRHTALTLVAAAGATLAELQAQAGHASPAAAMRYQHATQDRARELADRMDRVISLQGFPVSGIKRASNDRPRA